MTSIVNMGASVRARLQAKARTSKEDFQIVLVRYALERLLYRLSVSPYKDQFLLKGALLFNLWFDQPHRPTKDADLLGFGSHEIPELIKIFQELCAMEFADGVVFDAETVSAEQICETSHYDGIRVTFRGKIDGAACPMQIDIGYGDAVTPEADLVDYPVLLDDMLAPKLRAYPRYTVVAEKFEAVVKIGLANTRVKDYFDLWILMRDAEFEGAVLRQAIRSTFAARRTELPAALPPGLSDAFTGDKERLNNWHAFLKKNKLEAPTLESVVKEIERFLMPVVEAERSSTEMQAHWKAGGPWV